jgi:hypothetical protein
MTKDKEYYITNFDLNYDGMYSIKWDNQNRRIYLELNTILKMLEIEGLSYNEVDDLIKQWKPLHFNKVTMVVTGSEKNGKLSLRTSEMSDEYIGKKNLTMIEINFNAVHNL